MVRIAASEIMQARVDVELDLSKLGGPPRSLLRARHESAVVVDGLEQRDFEGIPGIENPIGARAETAWPIDADMGKRRHEVAGARTGHAPARGHEIQVADALHQPRIGLLLRGNEK